MTNAALKVSAALALALAGCNTSGPTVSTEQPAQPMAAPPVGHAPSQAPFGAPSPGLATPNRAGLNQPARQQVLHSTQTQKITVSPDGQTVRTDTTRTSVSVDPDRALAAAGQLLGGAMAGNGAQGLPGLWRAHSSSNRETCTVQLYGPPDALAGAADSSGCAYGGALQGISGWQFTGGQLHLKKGSETSLTLNPLGPNRYDGKLTWGILTTTISLYR